MTLTKLTAVGIVFTSGLLLFNTAVFGQTSASTQLASNIVPAVAPVAASPAIGPANLDPSALLERINAQEREIQELRSMVFELKNTVQILQQGPSQSQSIASTKPIVPAVIREVAYTAPSPAPEPLPLPVPEPKPAPVQPNPSYQAPRELLPDLGHIGAEVGFLLGASTNPYKDNKGFSGGGYIDLPFKNLPGGKLSYEIMLNLQQSATTQTSTSGVNVLANAVVNSYLGNSATNTSLTNYLASPLPITSTVTENSKVLTVAPVLFKYSLNKFGRVRPYIVGGMGMYVWIGSDSNTKSFNANTALGSLSSAPVGSSTLGATLNALLQGSQIGGLAPASPELTARGVPQGQGNLLFGGQLGGGIEVRVTPKFSMGIDVRHNFVEGTNAGFTTFAFKQGLHW